MRSEPTTRPTPPQARTTRKLTEPFAALPHSIGSDPTVPPSAKAVLLALLFYARGKPVAWPSDSSIGKRIGRHPGTVSRWLAWLEDRGLIRRERTDQNRTGRLIVLRWRESSPAPARVEGAAPAREDGDRDREREARRTPAVTKISSRLRSEPEPQPPAPPVENRAPELAPVVADPGPRSSASCDALEKPQAPAGVVLTPAESQRLASLPPVAHDRVCGWLASADPVLLAEARAVLRAPAPPPAQPATLPDLLSRIREDPSFPATAAAALCREWEDPKSYAGFLARLNAAWRGEIEVDDLVDAAKQASSGRARNPGALFMSLTRLPSV